MKTRKILAIAIITIMFLALFIGTASALTLPALNITSNQYLVGDKMTLDEVTSVEAGKTLQLYAVLSHGSGYIPDDPEANGVFVDKTNPEGLTWTSSNTSVATISSTGLVTGIKAGTTTITATTTDEDAHTKTDSVTITVTAAPAEFTDFSNVTFKVEDTTKYNSVTITFNNFSPLKGHTYSVYATQNASETYDPAVLPLNMSSISHDDEKNVYFTMLSSEYSRLVAEETKDAYLVVLDKDIATMETKMVLKPTKIKKPTITAKLGGGYIESFHVGKDTSSFYNNLMISDERKVTYKLGEVTDTSILKSLANKETDGFTKLLAYAKADSKQLATSSFNFDGSSVSFSNIAVATGKVSANKYYYVYTVADTENGKYVPLEDVVIFNGYDDGTLVHFAYVGSSTEPSTPSGNATTTPYNIAGDNSISTKIIPQTGETPVFAIVLGSTLLIAGVIVVANKKYREIK